MPPTRLPARLLQRQGYCVGSRHIRTLMKRMGVRTLYCKPGTSAPHPQHKGLPILTQE